MNKLSIYIHWPFCLSKCPYCDFNSHVTKDRIDHKIWLESYIKELEYFLPSLQNRVLHSVFFGGGTPSTMRPDIVVELLNYIRKNFQVASDLEVNLEANPTSSDMAKFLEFKKAGINRISVGVQSTRPEYLKFLGREHNPEEAMEAVKMAASIFDRFSCDAIYTLPEQKLDDWLEDLATIQKLSPRHLSLYQLTIEKGTEFYKRHLRGEFVMPNDDLSADFYEKTRKFLASHDMYDYEISNYAINGEESRHNLSYWNLDFEYLGIGPGAHGRLYESGKRLAIMMIHSPHDWLASIIKNGHGIQNQQILRNDEFFDEVLISNLRTKNGIDRSNFIKYFGSDILNFLNKTKLEFMMVNKFVEVSEFNFVLTKKGRMMMNNIIAELSL